ncbi:hypothetical protein TrVFT333_008910 [Trichoderma virens FT-333]|nr:hypothetical protein TrVFT333_008910 [Trichoderma virens FT-333]
MTYLSPGQQRPANPPHLPNPETALGYPPDRQGNEMRRTCSSRSPTEKDRILLYQWPVPTPSQLGITAASSSNNSSKVSGTGHGGADARTPHPESVAVTAFLQISHDRLGDPVVCLVNALGRRWQTDSLGHWTALAAGQYAEEMENYQLAGSQVLRQGMGVGSQLLARPARPAQFDEASPSSVLSVRLHRRPPQPPQLPLQAHLIPPAAPDLLSTSPSASPSTSLSAQASTPSSLPPPIRHSRSPSPHHVYHARLSRPQRRLLQHPPIVSKGYQPKGSYEEVGGYKTYVTGPADATKAIVVIYDIFGYFDQTVQGADILAFGDDHQKYKVFMPDWFKGKPCPIEYYPPDTPEKQQALGKFFGEFPPPKIAGYVPEYVDALKAHSPAVSKLAMLGYCWGGKVVALTVKAPTNPFTAAASAHPAMVDPADAEGLTIPFALLASGDENPEDVKKFEENLKVPHHVETFADQIHGWMAARSDLTKERVRAEYERGYKTLLEFFGKHL